MAWEAPSDAHILGFCDISNTVCLPSFRVCRQTDQSEWNLPWLCWKVLKTNLKLNIDSTEPSDLYKWHNFFVTVGHPAPRSKSNGNHFSRRKLMDLQWNVASQTKLCREQSWICYMCALLDTHRAGSSLSNHTCTSFHSSVAFPAMLSLKLGPAWISFFWSQMLTH